MLDDDKRWTTNWGHLVWSLQCVVLEVMFCEAGKEVEPLNC